MTPDTSEVPLEHLSPSLFISDPCFSSPAVMKSTHHQTRLSELETEAETLRTNLQAELERADKYSSKLSQLIDRYKVCSSPVLVAEWVGGGNGGIWGIVSVG